MLIQRFCFVLLFLISSLHSFRLFWRLVVSASDWGPVWQPVESVILSDFLSLFLNWVFSFFHFPLLVSFHIHLQFTPSLSFLFLSPDLHFLFLSFFHFFFPFLSIYLSISQVSFTFLPSPYLCISFSFLVFFSLHFPLPIILFSLIFSLSLVFKKSSLFFLSICLSLSLSLLFFHSFFIFFSFVFSSSFFSSYHSFSSLFSPFLNVSVFSLSSFLYVPLSLYLHTIVYLLWNLNQMKT